MTHRDRRALTHRDWHVWLRYAGVTLGVPLLLTVGLLILGRPLSSASITLLYQLGVLSVAITAGLVPSMLTALLGVLALHYFFMPTYFSFSLESGEDIVRLGVFLAVAISTSGLASRARTEAEASRRRAAETASLYELSQLISAQVDLATILPTIARTTCQLLQVPCCAILLAEPNGELREEVCVGEVGPSATFLEAPLAEGSRMLGILRIAGPAHDPMLPAHDRQLLDALAVQASLAIARARLVRQVAHTEALAHSDQLKSALIASISHDLRTPLAAIKGAASTLLADDIPQTPATQHRLARTIERETDQLDRTVRNLLDMSRIEAGAMRLDRGWHDVPELIGVVLQRLAPGLGERPVTVQVDPELPLVWVNAVLLEHVLTNLLENALNYSPPGSPIALSATVASARPAPMLVVTVRDYGPGIPPDEREHIFEKFYRGAATREHTRGSGLGLTICRGIVTAHGGTIWAANGDGGGAVLSLTLPLAGDVPATVGTTDAWSREGCHDQHAHSHRR